MPQHPFLKIADHRIFVPQRSGANGQILLTFRLFLRRAFPNQNRLRTGFFHPGQKCSPLQFLPRKIHCRRHRPAIWFHISPAGRVDNEIPHSVKDHSFAILLPALRDMGVVTVNHRRAFVDQPMIE